GGLGLAGVQSDQPALEDLHDLHAVGVLLLVVVELPDLLLTEAADPGLDRADRQVVVVGERELVVRHASSWCVVVRVVCGLVAWSYPTGGWAFRPVLRRLSRRRARAARRSPPARATGSCSRPRRTAR